MRQGLYFPVFVLAVATVVVVAYLQASLVLLRLGGPELHWGCILLGVPLTNGVIASVLTRRSYLASFLSSLLSAAVLFVLYRTVFWSTPPSVVQASAFFATLALFSGFGVSAARALGRRTRRRGSGAARGALLVAYHLLAVAAAVVTLLSYLQR